jgi:hypothetical protein
MVEMEMRQERRHRQVGQARYYRRDVAQAGTGIEQQRPLVSHDQIVPVDLMVLRLADAIEAGRDLIDRIPVVEPADIRICHGSGSFCAIVERDDVLGFGKEQPAFDDRSGA